MKEIKAFSARIFGMVQGVGFRYGTQNRAQRLNLTGYVKNAHDGSVEVEAEGAADQIDEFRRWLEHGPAGAIVREVNFTEIPARGIYSMFSVEF